MRRHEISDEHWKKVKDFLPGKPGEPRRITVVSSTRSCGLPRQGRRGGICRSASESGTPSSSDSIDGAGTAPPELTVLLNQTVGFLDCN